VGVEPSPRKTPRTDLKDELEHSIQGASPEALREALAALRKAKTRGGQER
jgi:hypothetical protein